MPGTGSTGAAAARTGPGLRAAARPDLGVHVRATAQGAAMQQTTIKGEQNPVAGSATPPAGPRRRRITDRSHPDRVAASAGPRSPGGRRAPTAAARSAPAAAKPPQGRRSDPRLRPVPEVHRPAIQQQLADLGLRHPPPPEGAAGPGRVVRACGLHGDSVAVPGRDRRRPVEPDRPGPGLGAGRGEPSHRGRRATRWRQ
jgi:hypothetical protein